MKESHENGLADNSPVQIEIAASGHVQWGVFECRRRANILVHDPDGDNRSHREDIEPWKSLVSTGVAHDDSDVGSCGSIQNPPLYSISSYKLVPENAEKNV